jgi:cysteinyl-tRNA synthetase
MNILSPSIEPQASGHIIEQQQFIREILEKGFAYESNGSVYFDVEKYHKSYNYGKLSGRKIEDLRSNTRELDGQQEKRSNLDFALWKKASPEHIMRWPSEWSDGFPGWHLECSVMSEKYLGQSFDIHGGGMDLLFPHHECEIAQSVSVKGKDAVKYWVHNNMITINNQKMSKSLGNFINLGDFFSGKNDLLDQAYSPMTIRFFMLQAHYRSTLDFSNEALKAAEKGLDRMFKALELLPKIKSSDNSSVNIHTIEKNCFEALSDDLNTPVAISHLFDAVKIIYSASDGKEQLTARDIKALGGLFKVVLEDILGMISEDSSESTNNLQNELIDTLLSIRQQAKMNQDFTTADHIRTRLDEMGIRIKDKKDGYEWEWK